MVWQDIVIGVASIIFAISLVPQIYYGFQKKKGLIALTTSIPTVIGIYVIAFAFYTLSLFFSAVISLITGTLWFILFVQKLKYKEV